MGSYVLKKVNMKIWIEIFNYKTVKTEGLCIFPIFSKFPAMLHSLIFKN